MLKTIQEIAMQGDDAYAELATEFCIAIDVSVSTKVPMLFRETAPPSRETDCNTRKPQMTSARV